MSALQRYDVAYSLQSGSTQLLFALHVGKSSRGLLAEQQQQVVTDGRQIGFDELDHLGVSSHQLHSNLQEARVTHRFKINRERRIQGYVDSSRFRGRMFRFCMFSSLVFATLQKEERSTTTTQQYHRRNDDDQHHLALGLLGLGGLAFLCAWLGLGFGFCVCWF